MTEPVTSRERIRAAVLRWIWQWGVTAKASTVPTVSGPLDELVSAIDEALFGPPPGPWVGPMLAAVELAAWRTAARQVGLHAEDRRDLLAILDHIDAQAATIRNQNEIMAAQASLIERWRVDLDVSDPEQVVVLARSEHEALTADLESLRSEVRRLPGYAYFWPMREIVQDPGADFPLIRAILREPEANAPSQTGER